MSDIKGSMFLIVTLLFGYVFISAHASTGYLTGGHESADSGDTMSMVRKFLAKHRGGLRYQPSLLERSRPNGMGFNDESSMAVGTRNFGRKRPNVYPETDISKAYTLPLPKLEKENPELPSTIRTSSTFTDKNEPINVKNNVNTYKPTDIIQREEESQVKKQLNINDVKKTLDEYKLEDKQEPIKIENKVITYKPTDIIQREKESQRKKLFNINDVKRTLDDYKLEARSGVQLSSDGRPNIKVMMEKLKAKKNLTAGGQQTQPPKNMNLTDTQIELANKTVSSGARESNITNASGLQQNSSTVIVSTTSLNPEAAQLNAPLIVGNTTEPFLESRSKGGNNNYNKPNTSAAQPNDPLIAGNTTEPFLETRSEGGNNTNSKPTSSGQQNTSFIVGNTTEPFLENRSKGGNNTYSKPTTSVTQNPDQYSTRSAGRITTDILEKQIPSSSFSLASRSSPSFSSNSIDNSYNWKPPSNNFQSSYFGQSKSNEKPDGCNVAGRLLLVGDKWSEPGVCGLFTCDQKRFRSISTQCTSLVYQEGSDCDVTEQDMSQEFPRCCPTLSCPVSGRKLDTPDSTDSKLKYMYKN